MGQWTYVAVMGVFTFLGTVWLEWGLRTRVYRRVLRLALAVVPAAAVFLVWDVYAIARGHWWFDETRILGHRVVGDVPVDEVVFFVMIPIAAVLTLEAVRSATGLAVGDEGPAGLPAGDGAAVGQRAGEGAAAGTPGEVPAGGRRGDGAAREDGPAGGPSREGGGR